MKNEEATGDIQKFIQKKREENKTLQKLLKALEQERGNQINNINNYEIVCVVLFHNYNELFFLHNFFFFVYNIISFESKK